MTEREFILEQLRPMFEEARRTGKWFHCTYQDLWFSPDELAKHQSEGKFIWGSTNWTLEDPEELVANAKRKIENAQTEYYHICRRVYNP